MLLRHFRQQGLQVDTSLSDGKAVNVFLVVGSEELSYPDEGVHVPSIAQVGANQTILELSKDLVHLFHLSFFVEMNFLRNDEHHGM